MLTYNTKRTMQNQPDQNLAAELRISHVKDQDIRFIIILVNAKAIKAFAEVTVIS